MAEEQCARKYLATMGICKSLQNLADVQVGDVFDEDKYVPFLWRSKFCKTEKFVGTAMHLLGHRIVGLLVELLKKIMNNHHLWKKITEFANPISEGVASF